MSKKPKLTRNFEDKHSEGLQTAPVMTFPASRVIYAPQVMTLPSPPPAQMVKREKVAIIGTAPSSRMLAPFADLTWDIWSCSPGNMPTPPYFQLPRIDAWFEIHANLHWTGIAESYGNNYIKWLSEQTFPVYLQDEVYHQKYFPHAVKFPAQELVNRYGEYWFNSSFAWMVAFAFYRDYKEVGLYGVDMASKDEYIQQRQGFNRWKEIAKDLGIKLIIPKESDLSQRPLLYGYSDATPHGRKLAARSEELKGRSQGMDQEIQRKITEIDNLKANKTYIDGARENCEYDMSIWGGLQSPWGEDIPLEAALAIVTSAGYQVSKIESPSEPLKESTNG